MSGSFDDFANVKKTRNIYSIRARLLGQKRTAAEVREIETNNGGHYKLIQLTKKGIRTGWRRRIETAQQCLRAYTGSDCVPALIYADSERLLVEWIEGTPLSFLNLKEQDYALLGRFIARSLRDIQMKSSEQVVEDLNRQLKILALGNILDTKLLESIASLLAEAAAPPENVAESICFGDTALKNFVRDTNGEFHYVDIFGIYKASVGHIVAKQLSMIPASFRKSFTLAFQQALPYQGIEVSLPFYYLLYLVSRIYTKSQKTGFLQRRRGSKKAQAALHELMSLMRAASAGEPLTELIMSVS
ncbi:MAG: hypothetical protein ACFFCW_03185 [Candidatus Hodarchaeota archaeon]